MTISNKNLRNAYQGEYILTAKSSMNTDTWQTGRNNNVLVLGCSGGGKTRHHLKPNLLQAQGSYIVLDGKGTLYREVGPYLQSKGYQVDCLDFTTMKGTVGYNPLDYIRMNEGRPCQQDMIAIARAICPDSLESNDPFWQQAAANYLTSYIAYVMEALPRKEQTFASVIRVFESACERYADSLFNQLDKEKPGSYAVSLYKRAKATSGAEKMHASIMGVIASNLLPLGFDGAKAAFEHPRRIDFARFGREKCALFVTMDDLDRSLDSLTGLFVKQAFMQLCNVADNAPGGRLAVPVRFMLDDFANLNMPDFDKVLSIIRSREISATIICQTVSQLEAVYGQACANSIIGNCDTQLVLGFQDSTTAGYFGIRANRTASELMETPFGKWWLFIRGQQGMCEDAYQLESHSDFQAMRDAQIIREAKPPAITYAPDYFDEDPFMHDEDLGNDLSFVS